ncbi:hypothetical protein [Peribacillus simplex]|uniref:hypothetical protein n=1 Tax=Peribacillus simplex TaxID=1478 RepID=UPI00333B321B
MYIYEIVEDLSDNISEGIIEKEFELHKNILTEQKIAEILNDSKDIELEKKHVKNLREQAAVLSQIIDHITETNYDYPSRTKHEVYGGYKMAKERQKDIMIDLKSIKVFNLYFRFRNQKTNALNTTAMMIRNSKTNEETILLLPDNTKETYTVERRFYIDIANRLLFNENHPMNPDAQSFLVENLNLLNIHERCTQSLLHEYGHILHWRIFDKLNLINLSDIYEWFHNYGYTKLMNYRSPEFEGASDINKVYLLKESLVEDYRIYLNMLEKSGMFILPNVNTFEGDFRDPTLLFEGVRCMRNMFEDFIKQEKIQSKQSSTSQEPNRIRRGLEIHTKAQESEWYPGKNLMTEDDHQAVIRGLRMKENRVFIELV